MWGFKAEPAAVAELIRLVMIAAIAFGLVQWSDAQQGALLAIVSVVLTMFVRQNVTSQDTLNEAGTSQAQIAAKASANTSAGSNTTTRGLGLILAAALASGSFSACVSTQGNINVVVTATAVYGERVGAILSEAQDLVIKGSPSPIPEASAAKAMVQFKRAGEVAVKLSDALAAYDAIPVNQVAARSAKVDEIRALLGELRSYVRVALVFIGDNPVGTQLLTLFDNLDAVFTQIETGFDRWALSQAA